MKTILASVLFLSLLIPSSSVWAYPPDNAAVIYYKCGLSFSLPEDLWDQVIKLPTSTNPIPQPVKDYLDMQRDTEHFLLRELRTASEIERCDWGMDFSQGFMMELPCLAKMKDFARLMLADGALAASEGDYATALKNNLVARRIGYHVSNEIIITFVQSQAISKLSNEALRHLLSTYPIDATAILQLKQELLMEQYRPLSLRTFLAFERDITSKEFRKITRTTLRNYSSFFIAEGKDPHTEYEKKIKWSADGTMDPEFLNRSTRYDKQFFDTILSLLEKPYPEAYTEFQNIFKKIEDDVKDGNEAAFLTSQFATASLSKIYSLSIFWKTDYNALLTAFDIYIAVKQTGKLPDKLPKSLYIDCFSEKPFLYEKSKDGFILRCQQEDLDQKKIHEYVFKLPK